MPYTTHRLHPHQTPEFTQLLQLFIQVFELEEAPLPDAAYLQKLLSRADFIVFVAVADQQVIGGLTAYVLQQSRTTQPLLYLYDLAVQPHWQRQGIGRALLAAVREYGQEINAPELFVQAETEDTEAVDFYRATGGEEMAVVHFTYGAEEV